MVDICDGFINTRRFDALIMCWTIPFDPDAYDVWHSSKTKPEELNFISYNNQEADKILEKGCSTFDQKGRKKCYNRFQEILAEDQPYTFLYVPDALIITYNREELEIKCCNELDLEIRMTRQIDLLDTIT